MSIKLIGAGFGRTGTTSIKAALEQLGLDKCYHMQEVIKNPAHVAIWNDAIDGKDVDWEALFAGYQAMVDWPACTFYKDLMARYPDAKVLLTVRNPESWYESCLNTIYGIYRKPAMRLLVQLIPPMRRFLAMNKRLIWQGTFDGRFEERAYALAVFTQHNEDVKRSVPVEKLLVYNVKEGWEPLCRFLNLPIPDTPFPHLNDTRSFQTIFRIATLLLFGIGAVGVGIGAWWIFLAQFQ